MTKVYFETYGCTLNFSDTELMQGLLVDVGFKIVNDPDDSEVIVLNTCAVKKPTENKFFNKLKKLDELKRPIIIAGCIAKALPDKLKKYSLISPDNINNIVSVIEETMLSEDDTVIESNILAAQFTNHGKTFRAIRYTDPKGNTAYYTPDGKSLKRAFLRSPVKFARVSSRFNLKRKHPVLNKIRAHKGVDYAARSGTAIRAAGAGKIIHRGRKGGYGRTVVLKHGSQYSTLYAHMSNYKRGLKHGSKVRQGDIIGYVGQSGLATGPHLHYEFRVNGVHKDPLRVKLPQAKPIKKQYLNDFLKTSEPLLAKLELLDQNEQNQLLASNP